MNKPKLIRLTTVDSSLNGLLKGQLKFLNSEFEVIGVANDSGLLEQVSQREGIRTIGIPMYREIKLFADLRSLWLLIKLFRKERPYIIHANTPKASLLSMVAGWITGVPHRIYYVTGLRFETTHGILRFVLKTMERITCLCATRVIPEGDGVKETLLREHITSKPMQKIHNGNINGVDLEYFDRTEEVINNAKAIRNDSNDFTFIFIGRIVRDKGVNELIDAFNRISTKYHNTKLLLLGKFEDALNPVSDNTRQIIEKNKHIIYAGFQSDVRPYLAASDVLILPSYREGFPNVVLQAGAMGLPSIVTDINGCNETIINGVNGLIIPKADADALYNAMECILNDTDSRTSMINNARKLIETRFRQQDLWLAILETYKSLQ